MKGQSMFKPFSRWLMTGVCAAIFGSSAIAAESAAKLEIGKPAPDFNVKNQDDKDVSPKDFLGKWAVIFFYPRDDTPGWTIEACGFRDHIKKLQEANAVVLGVSADSTKSHRKFIKKHELNYTLLSDPSRKMMNAYQGAKGKRTVRSTVIIDPKGNVAHRFAKVSVRTHAKEVLDKITELSKK